MPKFSNKGVDIYYEDYGQGPAVVMLHGWPLSHKMFEYTTKELVAAGFRAISYDRRGFGASARPWDGYDYDTLTSDLHALLNELDLEDATILGFSMGGGEVARYFTKYGNERVGKAVLVSSVVPIVKKTANNPDGVPQDAFDDIMEGLNTDRVKFVAGFGKNFYNYSNNPLASNDVSEKQLDFDWSIMAHASGRATRQTAYSWYETDFRADARNINVPTLIIHGDEDKVVPIATAGEQAAKLIPNNRYEVIEGAPHGLFATHPDQFHKILLDFLRTA